jgi:hypothetical protein
MKVIGRCLEDQMAILKGCNDGRKKYRRDLKRYIKKYLDSIYSGQKKDYD